MRTLETIKAETDDNAEQKSFLERFRESFENWWEKNVATTMTQEQIDWYDTMKIVESSATSSRDKQQAIRLFNLKHPDRPIPIQ